jgi:hypothetical protein
MGLVQFDPELLDDIVSLCCKVSNDRDLGFGVLITDLVEVRDRINDLRKLVANIGYKKFPGLRKPEK